VEGERVYLMAGGRDRSDWVRNVKANPRVTLEIGDETRTGTGSIVEPDAPEDQRARDLLVAKYATPTNLLVDWKRRSLPVTIEFPPDGIGPATPACESECTSRSRPPAAPSKP
jgi:hypothetical protein